MNKLAARLAALLLTIGAVGPAAAQLLPPLPPPPLPGGSLIVTLTSPGQGSTVKDTIPVSASVSIVGSLTVSRVEFFADGNFIGSDSGSPYSISWNTRNVGNGSHTLTAVAVDVLGVRWTSNSVTVTVANDITRPSVTINKASTQADPTSSSPIRFTAVFSEPVSGFTNGDVAIGGTALGTKTVTVSGSGSTYNAAVSGMTTSGTVVATIAAGVAQDGAGNTNTASTSTDNSVQFNAPDTTRPAVTINKAATQADPTSASPINFTVVFSEPVSDFTNADVAIGGTAGGAKSVSVTGGPSTYNAAVSGMTVSGTVIATIGAGAAQDAAGNTNTASTSTDNGVQFDAPDATPTITSFTPTSGPVGTVVTISGTNFTGVTAVTFNGVGAGFLVDSATSMRAEVPAGATTGPIGVTASGGTATSANPFTVEAPPAPTITSFTPASGPAGTIVTITGTNFSGTSAVSFNAVSAGFLVDSATSLRAEVPAGATTGPISVTTPGGTATSASSFTVETPAPTITSFTPTSGPVGTVVTISGTNFTGGTAVTFNGAGAGFLVDSATSLRAEVPAGATTGPISVTTPGGTATSSSAFTVETTGPTVTRFEESAASVTGTGWTLRGPEIAAFSGGTAGSSNVAGDTASFTFSGTAASWIGLKCSICGIATVSIDGGAPISVDTAGAAAVGSPGLASEVVFTSPTLAAGTHTLVITVTGNTTSGGAHVVVDAFDVTGGTGSNISRIEQNDLAVSYAGTWVRDEANAMASGGTFSESNVAGAVLTLGFTGPEVRWLGYRYAGGGIARVSVDGTFVGEVNTYSATAVLDTLFTAAGLSVGAHILTIEVTGTGEPAAVDSWVIIDAFDVTP